ncbi:MAG: PQQ-binding-like beta-propeller repeat protein [Planctomycetota bacterium]
MIRKLGMAALILIATTMLAGSPVVLGDSWPGYRNLIGDGVSDATLPVTNGNANLDVLWKAPTGSGFSSFAVDETKAITIGTETENGKKTARLIAFNRETGDRLWTFDLATVDYGRGGGDAGAPGNRGGDGPRTTPRIDGDHVYVFDANMTVFCVEANNGSLVWKRDLLTQNEGRNIKWENASAPLVTNRIVIVGGGGPGQSLLGLDKKTGDVVWAVGDEIITHASPTLAKIHGKPQAIFFTQSGLVSVGIQNGEILWRAQFPFSTSSAAAPVVAGNRVYCSAGYNVGAGLFEVKQDGSVDELWFKSNKLMNHWSTPVYKDGYLYGIYEFKKYGKAPLQCVELSTGKIIWSERGFGPGNVILIGDQLVVLSDSGELVITPATPDGFAPIARRKVVSGKCWSTPAYADGVIYVRSTTEGAAISVK